MLLTLAIVGLFVLPDPWRIVFVVAAAVVEVGEVYLWIRFLRRYRGTTGAEGIIGERSGVIDGCEPDGRVRMHSWIWTARPSEPVRCGERVRVTRVEGLTLTV